MALIRLRVGAREFAPGWLPTLVTLVLLALLVGLGLWQLDRARQKETMQSDFDSRAVDGALRLDGSERDPDVLRYRRARAAGSLDGARQFLLDNQVRNGIAGYHVLTPLRLDAGGAAVLVNRGWVPVGSARERLPEVTVAGEPGALEGMVTTPRGSPILLGESGYESSGWPRVVQVVDYPAMEAALGYRLLPFTLLLDPDTEGGYERDWQAFQGIPPERHRAYAFQWFSLALALMIIYLAANMRRPQGAD